MRKYVFVVALAAIIIAGLSAPGCIVVQAPPAPAVTPPPSSAVAPTPTPPVYQPPAATGVPASVLAADGKNLFAVSCADCHGDVAQGTFKTPALVGYNAQLGKYGTAQGLFDFMSTKMPLGAAGTLSKEAYLRLLAFCLLQNGYVSPSTPIDAGQLSTIRLVK
jgi:cytochrome c5